MARADPGAGLSTQGPVSAIIVTYRDVPRTLAAIASLKQQTTPLDEIIVVDNDPEHSARGPLLQAHPDIRLLHENNIGYAPACNRGASAASGDWLFFLNPDAAAEPDCLERLLAVAGAHPAAAVVTPQVLMTDGETVNAGENRIHLTGVTWCGRLGEAAEQGPPRPVFVTTGAAMLVSADHYRRLGGYCEEFFLFYEDPDLCWRAWVVGAEVWFDPGARVRHHYAWGEGTGKWFHLERNRLLSVLTNYRLSTLLVLAPLLLGTEAVLLGVASVEGWRREKLRAYASVWSRRRWIVRRRRELAAMRARPDADLIDRFEPTVDTPQVQSRVARRAAPLLRAYRAVAVVIVKLLRR